MSAISSCSTYYIVWVDADNTPYEKINGEEHSLSDMASFEIPDTWEWCRVGDLFTTMSGLAYKKDVLTIKGPHMVRVLRGGNIGEGQYYFKDDDVFISSVYVREDLFLKRAYMITPAVSSLEHIGKIALIDRDYGDTVVGGFVLMLIPLFSDDLLSRYLLYAFSTKHHRDNCRSITHKSGQAFYNLSRERMMNLPVPIPPRKEMKQIVDLLDFVLPYIGEYGKIESDLVALNTQFPEQLRKSILQLAVQGKLVPQDPSDEPASILLDRIRAEKERLIAAGKIKHVKHESIIYRRDNSHYEKQGILQACIDEELPFDIPETWEWVRLSSICSVITDGEHKTPRRVSSYQGYYLLSARNIRDGKLALDDVDYVDGEEYGIISKRCNPRKDDVLISCSGSVGRICRIEDDNNYVMVRSAAMVSPLLINSEFLMYALQSEMVQVQIKDKTKQTAQANLFQGAIRELLLPLPPISEQNRICEALLPLLRLCKFSL